MKAVRDRIAPQETSWDSPEHRAEAAQEGCFSPIRKAAWQRWGEPRIGPKVFLVALGAALAMGCRSNEEQQQKKDRDRLTMEMFQELIQEGTLRPVDTMGDPFSEIDSNMGETPEEYEKAAAARLEEAQRDPLKMEGTPQENFVELPFNAYATFGKRIQVHDETGLITKPYPMRTNMSKSVMAFIVKYGDFPIWNPDPAALPEGPQPYDQVRLEIEVGFDVEFLSSNMRSAGPALGKDIPMGDWLVVTANPDLLERVEFFIDTFAAGPPQIEIEAKIVEWVTRDALDLGVRDASMLFPDNTLVQALSWNFPNNAGDLLGGEFLASLGTVRDGVTYSAMFEALSSFENVSIISRPKVAVRDGGKAKIEAVTKLPYLKINSINNTGNIATSIDYQEVGVRMYVTPRLVGTGTIALQIDIEASQQTGNAITFQSSGGDSAGFVDTPILSTRSAETLVYLKPGQAVILGGLIAERVVEQERGIPIVKDIPFIGYLFKSTFDTTEKATLLFFIRPRVLEGSDLQQDF